MTKSFNAKYWVEYAILTCVWSITMILIFSLSSCRHEPFFPEDIMPKDSMDNPLDTMLIDTMDSDTMKTDTFTPCDSNKVYFTTQVLPIFNSNCALSGCHNEASAQDGVILTSYERVISTADVRPFDLNDSDLYKVLVENDEEKQMPPSPRPELSNVDIQLIAKWILQGAANDTCDDQILICDILDMSFLAHVMPIFEQHCTGCHSVAGPSGGIELEQYSGIKIVVEDGRLEGSITHSIGFEPMPQNLPKLPKCEIEQIISWINQGAKNN